MINKKVLNFWHSLQPREQSLLKIAISIIVITLLSLHTYKIILLIDEKNRGLEIEKNNFQYVFDKATNSSLFIKSQNSLNDFSSVDEFLMSEAKASNFLSFSLEAENGMSALVFSDPSIKKVTRFLGTISAHPSVSVTSVNVKPKQETFLFRAYLDAGN